MTARSASGRLERMAPLSGVLFALLMVAAVGAWGESFEPTLEAEKKAAFFLDSPEKALAGAQLLGLAAFMLVWFGAGLRSAILRLGGASDRFAALAFGGSIASASLLLAAAAVNGSLGLRADETGTLDAGATALVSDVGSLLVAAAAPIAMALITAGTGLAALRSRALLPTWLGWVSVVLTVGLVLMPINYIVVIGFVVWAAVVGIILYTREPAPV